MNDKFKCLHMRSKQSYLHFSCYGKYGEPTPFIKEKLKPGCLNSFNKREINKHTRQETTANAQVFFIFWL